MRRIILITLVVLASGCSSRVHKLDSDAKISVISYDVYRRGAYIRNFDNNLSILAEPPPDGMKTVTAAIEASAKEIKAVDPKLKVDWATQSIDLAKKSQSLQILREALYRLNELQLNGGVEKVNVCDTYVTVLKTVQAIALTELAKAPISEALKKEMFSEVKATTVGDEVLKSLQPRSIPSTNTNNSEQNRSQ